MPISYQPDPDLTLPHIERTLRKCARIASVLPPVIAILVLVGWALDVEVLKRVVPGLVAMNPMTAIGFLCLGIALALLLREETRTRRYKAGVALALFAVMIGFTKLLAILNIADLRVDQLFFPEKVNIADAGPPNRMAPNTALNLVLLGGALAMLDRGFLRMRFPSQTLAVIGGMASLLALVGYAYSVRWFYGIGAYVPMALHSAVCFVLIAAGILCARPSRGSMAVVSSRTSGGVLARRLLPAVVVIPALLGGLRLFGQRTGLFDSNFGLWLLVVGTMTVLAVLVGWNARLLFRSDVERSRSEQTLAYQATHDALTQLPNRRLFIARLNEALQSTGSCGVLFLDLDLFKVINDSLGHVVGDELLVAAGERIAQSLDADDLVARLSGDEFTVLMPNADADRAIELANRILRSFGEPFAVGANEVFTTVSIGITIGGPEDSPIDLIRRADIAMYRAKARGKARYEMFDSSMDLAAVRRMQLETELRHALAHGELRVYYQPEVEIESGLLVGMEALVRWEHPERGLISPVDFIPVAEESGLILQIGRYVLFEACRQARQWQKVYQRDRPLMVSVNLSGKHFQQASLIDEVAETLAATGLEPAHLILEITETVAMAGAETTVEILTRLKALGILLAIDDFGTGFSSLAYLKRFPVDLLKIDKSFVDGLGPHGRDRAIVKSIISLGHALGLTVIAEGVETLEQLDELKVLGSELGQGFYFSRALSDDETGGMPHLLATARNWKRPFEH